MKIYIVLSFWYSFSLVYEIVFSGGDSMGTNGDQYFNATFNAMGIQDFPPFVSPKYFLLIILMGR